MKKYYKAMNADMTCRGMKYKVGHCFRADKTSEHHGDYYFGTLAIPRKLCTDSVLHFSDSILGTLMFYPDEHTENHIRFFEVEPMDNIYTEFTDGYKYGSESLFIKREIEGIELKRMLFNARKALLDMEFKYINRIRNDLRKERVNYNNKFFINNHYLARPSYDRVLLNIEMTIFYREKYGWSYRDWPKDIREQCESYKYVGGLNNYESIIYKG